ncbi:MAG: metallophosphoesterase [Clostridia bacterium]|nr:metallophosphoesterase [Clostridia bacterium]
MKSVKFTVFSDFHYHRPSWPSRVQDLDVILRRGAEAKVDFVIHAGDFCTQMIRSPEIKKAYLENKYGLAVYGIYGNHELECMNHGIPDLDTEHPMQYVTPYLTNREVHWGTPDGKMAEWGAIGYYWFEVNGFRFVCTDTAYSMNVETGEWVHNPTLYVPKGNRPHEALGEPQLAWLEEVLTDAAHKGIPCIVFSHCPFMVWTHQSSDHEHVREIFDRVNAIRKGTVVAAVSGHQHTDYGTEKKKNVLYLDINSAINGHWQGANLPHYEPWHTYTYTEYDEEGNPTKTYERPYSELWTGEKGWFYKDPLSANVTVYEDGTVDIQGTESEWVYNVLPPVSVRHRGMQPRISSGTYKVEREL